MHATRSEPTGFAATWGSWLHPKVCGSMTVVVTIGPSEVAARAVTVTAPTCLNTIDVGVRPEVTVGNKLACGESTDHVTPDTVTPGTSTTGVIIVLSVTGFLCWGLMATGWYCWVSPDHSNDATALAAGHCGWVAVQVKVPPMYAIVSETNCTHDARVVPFGPFIPWNHSGSSVVHV